MVGCRFRARVVTGGTPSRTPPPLNRNARSCERLRLSIGGAALGCWADAARASGCSASSVTAGRHSAPGSRRRSSWRSSPTCGRCGRRRRSRRAATGPRPRRAGRLADLRASCPSTTSRSAVPRRVLASVVANHPSELIAVVDGGDARDRRARRRVLRRGAPRSRRSGKRAAIAAGLRASDPSDRRRRSCSTPTRVGARTRSPSCCGRSPTRASAASRRARRVFEPGDNPVRRLADWIEDIRYHLTVPAQSVFGQVGCLAGRTIAYRRAAFEPAVERLVAPDRARRPAARRRRPRAHQRAAAQRLADRLPVDRAAWRPTRRRTGRRSGASSCAGAARASARRC